MFLRHRPPEQHAFGKNQHREPECAYSKLGNIVQVQGKANRVWCQLADLADHAHIHGLEIDEVAGHEHDKEHRYQWWQPRDQPFGDDQQHDHTGSDSQRCRVHIIQLLNPFEQTLNKTLLLQVDTEQLAPLADDDHKSGAIQVTHQYRRRQETGDNAKAQCCRRNQYDAGEHRQP